MTLLKPHRRLQRLPPFLHQAIDVFAKNGIGQHALDPIARDRLQNNPGVMRDLPQFGIELPPHFVGGMIPRPTHIQGQLRQGIESLDFRGQKVVYRVADAGLFAHAPPDLFRTESSNPSGYATLVMQRLNLPEGGVWGLELAASRRKMRAEPGAAWGAGNCR